MQTVIKVLGFIGKDNYFFSGTFYNVPDLLLNIKNAFTEEIIVNIFKSNFVLPVIY